MNERPSKPDSGGSDNWDFSAALNDDEIDAAAASDPDDFSFDAAGLLGQDGDRYRYQAFRDESGAWRWLLVASTGAVVARSGRPYASRAEAIGAISLLKEAVGSASPAEMRSAAE